MMKKISFLLLLLAIITTSCKLGNQSNNSGDSEYDYQKAKVKEVIQTTAYTYLRVEKNNAEEWIAINKMEVKTGDIVYYKEGLKMENFTSPELQRTFETVYFVQEISNSPILPKMPQGMTGTEPKKPALSKLDIKIEQPKDGIAIVDLYTNRNTYSGKIIKVKGQVTKVNLAIMNKNWVHIQDGTADGNNFDLTITTSHEPKVGDIVTYSGTLVLNRDFGSGYSYEILLEDALPLEQL